ncbi:hypothetical protein [Streptantibioticus silvisoli]|uniref:Uncharacterized protein n=1 Tax=Streptantibioticus silvisoli TaxID=2705255 RepID=A0ABT6VXG0_9ACTN|nr:hypothetical protein [Streptantibioticus silvisoli]MDI5963179.1 hypothetical protein [Streptantibioticus silvisoli]
MLGSQVVALLELADQGVRAVRQAADSGHNDQQGPLTRVRSSAAPASSSP